MNPSFQALIQHKRELTHAIQTYETALDRGADAYDATYEKAVNELYEVESQLEKYFHAILKKQSSRLQQPSVNYPSLPSVGTLPEGLTVNTRELNTESFKKAILLLQFPGNKTESVYDQLAGYLASVYPEDSFTFVFDVNFTIKQNGQTHTSETVPIVILKKGSNNIHALADIKVEGRSSLRDKVRNYLRPYRQ
jgi:hypothetical protein